MGGMRKCYKTDDYQMKQLSVVVSRLSILRECSVTVGVMIHVVHGLPAEPAGSPQEPTSKKPPVIVNQPNSYVEAPADEKLRLVIEVKGESPLQYTWYKNTKQLLYAQSNVLEIPNASHLDTGQYCCSIANDHGSILSSTYAVKVIRKPVARGEQIQIKIKGTCSNFNNKLHV